MLSDGLPREMSTRPHSLHRFDEPVTNRSKWNGKRRLACDDVRRPPSKTYGCTLEVEGTNRVDRPAVTATITRGLRLGRSEVLRSLRHHTSDRLEERGVDKEKGKKKRRKKRSKVYLESTRRSHQPPHLKQPQRLICSNPTPAS